MKAVIPTGGRGTRMRPLTFSTNKHFIPIAGKPLIFYPIQTIADAGIKEIGITYNPSYLEEVKNVLGNGDRWGLKFTYVLQEEPKGLANIFQVAEEFIDGDSFVMHLGDNIFVDGISELVSHFEKEKPDGLVAMVHHSENTRLGVPYFDDKGRLVEYVEKPENPPHDFAIPGIYFFSNGVFECFKGEGAIKPSPRGELEISAPYQWLIDKQKRVDVLEYKGKWLDPGKIDDWLDANQYLLEHMEKRETGNNTKITGSKINEPVVIGENVVIEDSEIGPNVSIGDGCEIKNSKVSDCVLMNGVKISGLGSGLEHSLIGTDTEITSESGGGGKIKLFVGEKCKIQI